MKRNRYSWYAYHLQEQSHRNEWNERIETQIEHMAGHIGMLKMDTIPLMNFGQTEAVGKVTQQLPFFFSSCIFFHPKCETSLAIRQ